MSNPLYSHDQAKANCGFGVMVHLQGQPSNALLQRSMASLTCVTHRGGVNADGKTGDGCGLLMQMPEKFMRGQAQTLFGVALQPMFAVGMIFFSSDGAMFRLSQRQFEREIAKESLINFVGWRAVPVDPSVLGSMAKINEPKVMQAFVDTRQTDRAAFECQLYKIVRKAQKIIGQNSKRRDIDFYVASFSSKVLSYKGLTLPADLPLYYQDLQSPDMETAICLFHQRFSTNTSPSWDLAQPFHFLAHNGEINTITGNRNWVKSKLRKFISSKLGEIEELEPLVREDCSDSASIDQLLRLLVHGGMNMLQAVRMIVPPAWQNNQDYSPAVRAFHVFNSLKMEPWDGPAGLVFTDGRYAVCALDRNGLRPARWVRTNDDIMTIASEIGVNRFALADLVQQGRIGPGEMLAIDTKTGEILTTTAIDAQLAAAHDYQKLLDTDKKELKLGKPDKLDDVTQNLHAYQKLFQCTYEEVEQVFTPLVGTGEEATGAMGDDTPLAVMSEKNQLLSDYFRQLFAQITNPAIDSLRETKVMSLDTTLGRMRQVFDIHDAVDFISFDSPIINPQQIRAIKRQQYLKVAKLSLAYNPQKMKLRDAVHNLRDEAAYRVRHNKAVVLIISDRKVKQTEALIHPLLAVGAINHHLVDEHVRADANIVVETGYARDPHQCAVLIGYGASLIYPYLAYAMVRQSTSMRLGLISTTQKTEANGEQNFIKAINKGLLKIMSKMGISCVASYRCAQLFEIIGLDQEVVSDCFRGSASRIQGSHWLQLDRNARSIAALAYLQHRPLEQGGKLKYIHGGEYHAYNPDVVELLRKATASQDAALYQEYANAVNTRNPAFLRDLLKLRSNTAAIDIATVEPIADILWRFDSAAMSLGALSPEAHQMLAQAMNIIGGRSNSGEGGEDPQRHNSPRRSKIKQVASGRFGVTAAYLVNAEVIQIKIAQGAKPGEGGQLPGPKVNSLIAKLRYSVPGITLISPPPHHDIYSIEDLAQLIFDLKQVNPSALVSVKLVAAPGVGTVACGVAKSYADLITISGYDGGTGASPLTSIHHAGTPWELGLSETHQALRINGMRHRVRLQTDGGLKTGLDVVKAAILGAESFGFGTAPMIAMGCKYLRICHLNNCATGIATQQERLREDYFKGTVAAVVFLFQSIAQETREWLAALGYTNLQEIIGKVELLEQIPGHTNSQRNIDLGRLLIEDYCPKSTPQFCDQPHTLPFNEPKDQALLAKRIAADTQHAVANCLGGTFSYTIHNAHRSIGAMLAGDIAKLHGNHGMAHAPLYLHFTGVAGQSFGAWNVSGMRLHLTGCANDYVGKGMTGGSVAVVALKNDKTHETPIIGNTCLYGATGGTLYVTGLAGERFAVRNSGAHAVILGAGDHCCEYMTGGSVIVMGGVGDNFGAGMSGGFAYVWDVNQDLQQRLNVQDVVGEPVPVGEHQQYLLDSLHAYHHATGCGIVGDILKRFKLYSPHFFLVRPHGIAQQQLLSTFVSLPLQQAS